jgi:hypothetical protein
VPLISHQVKREERGQGHGASRWRLRAVTCRAPATTCRTQPSGWVPRRALPRPRAPPPALLPDLASPGRAAPAPALGCRPARSLARTQCRRRLWQSSMTAGYLVRLKMRLRFVYSSPQSPSPSHGPAISHKGYADLTQQRAASGDPHVAFRHFEPDVDLAWIWLASVSLVPSSIFHKTTISPHACGSMRGEN